MSNYEAIKESVELMTVAPDNWVKYFEQYADEEDKTIAYYCCAIKYPEALVEILEAYHGRELNWEAPEQTVKTQKVVKEKRAKVSRTSKLVEIMNVVTNEKVSVAGGDLLKEFNATGIVFSKGEKDKIIFYNKTVNGWKRVTPYLKGLGN